MAATVEDLHVHDPEADEAQDGSAFVLQLVHVLCESLHVMSGTRGQMCFRLRRKR